MILTHQYKDKFRKVHTTRKYLHGNYKFLLDDKLCIVSGAHEGTRSDQKEVMIR